MFGYIWVGMIIFSLIVGLFSGNAETVALAAAEGAQSGVTMTLELLGIIAFWNGIMKIAEEGGIINILSKVIKPIYKCFFKTIPIDEKAGKNILMNITANILGLGNAATPFGIKAMQEIGKTAGGIATNEMIMFLVFNTASIQLIPTTVISMRAASGSGAPSEIIIPVWIVSVTALTVGIITAKLFSHGGK
ncbi:MAG: spore maturation protein [Clostridia bacterium]|nr:spore maturation protein [Clostridia bacterium]